MKTDDDTTAFVAVVREHWPSLAAKESGLTQPAVARRVRTLEESPQIAPLDRATNACSRAWFGTGYAGRALREQTGLARPGRAAGADRLARAAA